MANKAYTTIIDQLEPAAAEQVRAGNLTIYAGMAASQSISLRRIADLCDLAATQEGVDTQEGVAFVDQERAA